MTWQSAFLPEPRVGGSNQSAPEDGLTALTHSPGRLGAAWLHELERAPLEARDRMLRGRNQARRGRLRALEIGPGTASAEVVAETLGHPTLRVRPFQRQEWEVLHTVLRSDLDLLAALMEGDVRDELLQRLQARDVHLVPRHEELSYDCDCGDYVTPCAHVAALMNVITDALDGDPFQLLTLRGRTRDQALAALRETLGDEPVGAMRITPDDEPPPDGDWLRSPTEVPEFSCSLAGHVIPAAGLRALGPIPGAPDLLPALLPLYESGATAAVTILERASTLRPRRSAGDSGARGAADAAGLPGGAADSPDAAALVRAAPGERADQETPWERERRLRARAAQVARHIPGTDGSGGEGAFGDATQAPSGAHTLPTPQGGQASARGSGLRDPGGAATHVAAGASPDLHLSREGWRASAAGAITGGTTPRAGPPAALDLAHGSRNTRLDRGLVASARDGRPGSTEDARGHIEDPRASAIGRGPVASDQDGRPGSTDTARGHIEDPGPLAIEPRPVGSAPDGRPGSTGTERVYAGAPRHAAATRVGPSAPAGPAAADVGLAERADDGSSGAPLPAQPAPTSSRVEASLPDTLAPGGHAGAAARPPAGADAGPPRALHPPGAGLAPPAHEVSDRPVSRDRAAPGYRDDAGGSPHPPQSRPAQAAADLRGLVPSTNAGRSAPAPDHAAGLPAAPASHGGADGLIGLLLGAGWMTSPQIASASGRRVSEIRRELAALLRVGAVSREERADGVWWRGTDAR